MKNKTKEVIIIAGANGSGITTLARMYCAKYPFELINADEIAKEISPENVDQAKLKVLRTSRLLMPFHLNRPQRRKALPSHSRGSV